MLEEHPEIQGVWAANDAMTQGAMRAAEKCGKKLGKDIYFVGMDLDTGSVEAVKNGEQLFDIGGHWLQIGFGLIILYDHLRGYGIPKGRSIIKLSLLPLTVDKIKQYMKDFPKGLPQYNFRKNSLAYNPKTPRAFMGIRYNV
jgi:ABC-type sugar transport system substrate-binding protein